MAGTVYSHVRMRICTPRPNAAFNAPYRGMTGEAGNSWVQAIVSSLALEEAIAPSASNLDKASDASRA